MYSEKARFLDYDGLMRQTDSSRRSFLAGALTTSAALAANRPATSAKSAARVIGANDRINVGFIGVGGRGSGHLRSIFAQSEQDKDVQVVAVCDVYSRRKQRAKETAKLEDSAVQGDYRELLERRDVNAVFIATPDHWHAPMAIEAMAAGKDVYLEKPFTLTIPEARAARDAAKRYGRIMQIGSQHLSDPRHHKARELIAAGEIGPLLWAQGTYSRNSKYGEWNYYVDEEGTQENIDWKRWLGPAPKRAFSAERYFRWRKYWDYSGGIATDLFYHKLGPLLFAMGAQPPTRVTGSGGIYVQKDREVPDTYATIIEYTNFYINLSSSMANAAPGKYFPEVIYGHNGSIVFERNRVLVVPELLERRGRADAAAPEAKIYDVAEVNAARAHTDNFFDCMRTRKQPVLNPELGYQIMVAIKLGVDSYREGKTKFFDPGADRESSKGPGRPVYEGDGKNPPDLQRRRA